MEWWERFLMWAMVIAALAVAIAALVRPAPRRGRKGRAGSAGDDGATGDPGWSITLTSVKGGVLLSDAFGQTGMVTDGATGARGQNGGAGAAGATGATGGDGATGDVGVEGPALFTLVNENGRAVLGSNSITTDSDAESTPDVVRTIELYPSAFCTFRLASAGTVSSPLTAGLINTNDINTFAFGFQFGSGNALDAIANEGGSVPLGSYNPGDIFSVVTSPTQYRLIQNGMFVATGINSVAAGGTYYAGFYLPNPTIAVDLIAYGYQS